jgi:hypothetical protein
MRKRKERNWYPTPRSSGSYTASARASAKPVKRVKRKAPASPEDKRKCLIVGRHHPNFPEGEYEVCLTENQRRTLFKGEEPKPAAIGTGTFAGVWPKPDDPTRVIKFTRDAADVAALVKAQDTGVVPKVYATYKLKQKSTYRASDDTTPVYAVELERLRPLSAFERELMRDNRRELVLASFDDADGHAFAEDLHAQCTDDFNSMSVGPVCSTFRVMEKLRAAGIEWHDIHAENVGYDATGKLKALDLGLTKVKFKRKPVTLAGLRRALAGARAALKRAPKL